MADIAVSRISDVAHYVRFTVPYSDLFLLVFSMFLFKGTLTQNSCCGEV